MVPIVTALYAGGPADHSCDISGCVWLGQPSLGDRRVLAWKDLTCSFTLALVPVGFGMWLAHFSNHLVAGWSSFDSGRRESSFPEFRSGDLSASMDAELASLS